MKCFICKGSIKSGTTTFMADFGTCIVIIKNVPAMICEQCGEVSYTD